MRCLGFLAVLLALFSALYSFLDARLEQFYIFEPGHLHDLSQRAIAAHGNNTRGVVDFIVAELDQKVPSQYVNKDEEWVFNNAGGAMGAMYIIHASTFFFFFFFPPLTRVSVRSPIHGTQLSGSTGSVANYWLLFLGITEYLIVFGAFLSVISF